MARRLAPSITRRSGQSLIFMIAFVWNVGDREKPGSDPPEGLSALAGMRGLLPPTPPPTLRLVAPPDILAPAVLLERGLACLE
jgi:hypothetical protein